LGTLIIFIALILVAAVAAGVLIRTAGELRAQARATGREAIHQVAAGVRVVNIKGEVANEIIENVSIVIKLRPGSPPIDLREMVLQYTSKDTDVHLLLGPYKETRAALKAEWGELGAENFGVVRVIEDEGLPVFIMTTAGAVRELWIDVKSIEPDNKLLAQEKATIKIMPKVGFEAVEALIVPEVLYGINVVRLG
jgi:archaellin